MIPFLCSQPSYATLVTSIRVKMFSLPALALLCSIDAHEAEVTTTPPPPRNFAHFSALTHRCLCRCCVWTCAVTSSRRLAGTGASVGGRVLMAVLMVMVATAMSFVVLTITHRSS